MKNCYALFIGINEYQSDIPNLDGCVSDANRFREYLSKNINTALYNFHPQSLLTSDAENLPTRANIIQSIKTHLGQANKEDIALLFYAGHGSKEKAHPYFDETDKNVQTLVPCDARVENPATGLATKNILDKELRYIFHQLWENKQPEIIFIQDSCHSTGATRLTEKIQEVQQALEENKNLLQEEQSAAPEPVLPKARYTSPTHYERSGSDWQNMTDVQLAAAYTAFDIDILTKLKTQLEATDAVLFHQLIPEAEHIHFAACDKHQYAYEVSPSGGVFTTTLVKVLQAVGNTISYHDLYTRVRLQIGGLFEQAPSLYIHKSNESELHQPFLDDLLKQTKLTPYRSIDIFKGFYPVVYNATRGWHTLANEMTLLPALSEKTPHVPIEIFHQNVGPTGKTNAILSKVAAQYSYIQFSAGINPPAQDSEGWYCAIPATYMRRWRVPIILSDKENHPFKTFSEKNESRLTYFNSFVRWTTREKAKFILDSNGENFEVQAIHRYEDGEDLQLAFRPTESISDKDGFRIMTSLQKISKWLTVKNLFNKLQIETLANYRFGFDLTFWQDKRHRTAQKIHISSTNSDEFDRIERGEVIPIDAIEENGIYFWDTANPQLEFNLEIEHQAGPRDVYYSVLLLNDNYGILPMQTSLGCNLLPQNGKAKLANLVLEKPEQMQHPDSTQVDSVFYLKIFIAFSRFDVSGFLQKGLPPALSKNELTVAGTSNTRHKISQSPPVEEDTGMWASFTIPIVVE